MSPIPPIRKTARVRGSPERAFRLFTARMADWWPFETQSALGTAVARFDPPAGPGSRIAEHAADGRTVPWGEVLAWEPPHRLVFSFGANEGWARVTEVEVRFEADGGDTVAYLEHRGWERLGEQGHDRRAALDEGWDVVFAARFAAFANCERA